MNGKQWLQRANKLEAVLRSVYTVKISREERMQYMKELKRIRSEIFNVVKKIDDYTSQVIIIERYINGKRWSEIASKLNYSTSWVKTRLNAKAVRDVEKILNESK